MEVNLPLIGLREYQEEIWDVLISGSIKRAILVWHRRAGKDLFCLNYMIAKAIQEKGNYWYILPQQNQVRRSIWEGITKDGIKYLSFIPQELIFKKNESEMKVVLRDPSDMTKAGSIISFIGGDNYDGLVGAGIKGAVVSEYALQKPSLWELALEPMLVETGGWVLFNTTPRGENHAFDMLEYMKKSNKCLASVLTIDDTKTVDIEVIEEQRARGKPEELIQQEFYCSFDGAIHGSYYGDILKKHPQNLTSVPYTTEAPVHTLWDLGVSDSMAIWFVQIIGREIRIIDYYEASGFGLSHYANMILSKPYTYAFHNLPHDGGNRVLTPTERAMSISQQLMTLGLERIRKIPRTNDVYADIQKLRAILPACMFDETKTKAGYQAVKQYRREWDEKRARFKDSPCHDWTSHGSDALRILPYILNFSKPIGTKTKRYAGIRH